MVALKPPFIANSLDGLFKKITKGDVEKISCVFLKSSNITKKRPQQHERMFLFADYASCVCFKIILCNDSISVS